MLRTIRPSLLSSSSIRLAVVANNSSRLAAATTIAVTSSSQRIFSSSSSTATSTTASSSSPSPSDAVYVEPGYEYLIKSVDKYGICTIKLNRSQLHNAFNEHVISEITRAFQSIDNNSNNNNNNSHPSIRAVIITADGPSFSAGADLNWMKKMKNYTVEENQLDSNELFMMFYSMKKCSVPVIGRINGHALGGGAGLVACCDIAFAVDSAKFGFTEVKLGLAPAVISRFVLDKIGKSHASRYFLTGERFSSTEAVRIGLLQQSFSTITEVDNEINQIIQQLLQNSPAAVKVSKVLVEQSSSYPTVLESKDYVTSTIARLRVSNEGQEGVSSFLEKRSPSWHLQHHTAVKKEKK